MRELKGPNGWVVARVDSSGFVTLGNEPGPIVGKATNGGEVYDDDGGTNQVGHVDLEGNIFDMQYQELGRVDGWGRVYDKSGMLIGNVEKPVDAGVLMLLVAPPEPARSGSAGDSGQSASLMNDALELAEDHRFPKVRRDFKPLTESDLYIERLPPKSERENF